MLTVKLSSISPEWPWLRQTPGGTGRWSDCRFVVEQETESCDYWVVYEGLHRPETTACPRHGTLLITAEPPSIKLYRPGYLAQFGSVLTCHRTIRHPDVVLSQQALPWHVGRHYLNQRELGFSKDYDELRRLPLPSKRGLISVICSNKSRTAGHRRRLALVERLKAHFGDRLDVFGRGIREVEDKWEAIAPYRYHIVLENGVYPHYWTEKLADAFLGGAFPIYAGCPNLEEYFPPRSFVPLDAGDSAAAIRTIEQCVAAQTYERSLDLLLEAKVLVLDRYNLFPVLESFIKARGPWGSERVATTIRPEAEFPRSLRLRRMYQRFQEGRG